VHLLRSHELPLLSQGSVFDDVPTRDVLKRMLAMMLLTPPSGCGNEVYSVTMAVTPPTKRREPF
jgi:hypothetical protein